MAEETDAGDADSTTKVASVCGLWSAGVAALLSAYPLVFFCVHQLLFPCLEVLIQGNSPPRAVSCMQGPPRMRHRCRAFSCLSCRHRCIAAVVGQWFSSLMPALHRGCLLGYGHRSCSGYDPASEVCAPEQSVHTGKASTRQDLGVGHSFVTIYAQYTADIS